MKLKNPILKEYRVFKISVRPPAGKALLYFVDDVDQKSNHQKIVDILSSQKCVLVFDVKKTTHDR